jgi:hypothetical protein
MARETKAQREERLEAERQARWDVARATYTERMMTVFARAVKMNFELTVDSNSFSLSDRDERRATPFLVYPTWSELADSDLLDLEQAVEWKEEAAAEAERLRNLRQTALAKLTDEERRALSV